MTRSEPAPRLLRAQGEGDSDRAAHSCGEGEVFYLEQTTWKEEHPRLFFDRQWVQQFRAQLHQNESLHSRWEKWMAQADQLLAANFFDETYADGEDSQHGRYGEPSGQVSQMGIVLGMAYQVTGEAKYAQKLRDALLHYGAYRKWYGKGLLRNDPPWQSELNTSRFCYGFATGYDCIHDTLSEAERATIRDAVVRLGILPTLEDWILPETRIHALDSMGHNWWAVMVGLAGVAALAIVGEEPQAEGWVAQIVAAIPYYFAYKGSVLGNKSPNYDDKGAMYESVGYANYGLYEYLTFRLAYQHMSGVTTTDDIPMLTRAGEHFLHTFYPASGGSMTVNFGDGNLHGNAAPAVRLLLANRFEGPRLRWYLSQWNLEYTAYDFICHDRIHGGAVHPPDGQRTSEIYEEIGWAAMRAGWESDATLLAVKSGFTWNHAHADAGSFILFHQGRVLIGDSGNCSYGRPEYNSYYRDSLAHNVVLYNGQGEDPEAINRGGKEPGQVCHLIDHPGLRYVYADAAGPTARFFSRNFRHFLWVEGVILVLDDLRTHEPGTLQWLLHYEGTAARLPSGDIRLMNGPAEATVRSLFPTSLRVTEEMGLADHDPDRKLPYYSLATPAAVKEAKFLTAIIPMDGGEPPQVTPLEGTDMIGARIVRGSRQTDVLVNLRADGRIMHRNSINTMSGWTTDAYLLALTRPVHAPDGSLERCFFSFGSFLRRGDATLYSSLSKSTTAFSMEGMDLVVSMKGQPRLTAEILPPDAPARVLVNGTAAEPERVGGRIRFGCQPGQPVSRRPG